jgi:hypothetical protein
MGLEVRQLAQDVVPDQSGELGRGVGAVAGVGGAFDASAWRSQVATAGRPPRSPPEVSAVIAPQSECPQTITSATPSTLRAYSMLAVTPSAPGA